MEGLSAKILKNALPGVGECQIKYLSQFKNILDEKKDTTNQNNDVKFPETLFQCDDISASYIGLSTVVNPKSKSIISAYLFNCLICKTVEINSPSIDEAIEVAFSTTFDTIEGLHCIDMSNVVMRIHNSLFISYLKLVADNEEYVQKLFDDIITKVSKFTDIYPKASRLCMLMEMLQHFSFLRAPRLLFNIINECKDVKMPTLFFLDGLFERLIEEVKNFDDVPKNLTDYFTKKKSYNTYIQYRYEDPKVRSDKKSFHGFDLTTRKDAKVAYLSGFTKFLADIISDINHEDYDYNISKLVTYTLSSVFLFKATCDRDAVVNSLGMRIVNSMTIVNGYIVNFKGGKDVSQNDKVYKTLESQIKTLLLSESVEACNKTTRDIIDVIVKTLILSKT